MRRFLITSFLILMIGVLTAAVAAQPPAPDDGGHKGFGHRNWGKMSANVENLRMLKLLEVLDLSEKQSEKFVPLLHGFRKDTKALRQEREILIEGIREMLKGETDDSRILAELDKLKENEARHDTRQEKFRKDCQVFLTVPQLARLVIFQERFEREMLESLREYRRHGGKSEMNRKPGKI